MNPGLNVFGVVLLWLTPISATYLRTDTHADLRTSGGHTRANGLGVFVAGLEGTGHHFWGDVFRTCAAAGACKVPGSVLNKALYVNSPSADSMVRGWSLEALNASSGVLVMNTAHHEHQMLSFPYGRHKHTSCALVPGEDGLCYPALDVLSRSARLSGNELKIVVLFRDADSILASVKRRFNHTEDLLVRATIELERQLRLVPRESILCVETEDLPWIGDGIRTAFEEGRRIAPGFDYTAAMNATWSPPLKSGCKIDSCRATFLAERLDSLRRLCGRPGAAVAKRRVREQR